MRSKTTAIIAALALLSSAHTISASVFWDVRFDSASIREGIDTNLIRDNLLAAADAWTRHLDTASGVRIDVIVRFDSSIPRAGGRSLTSSYVTNNGLFDVFEQGLAAELRTGIDPNGSTPDVEIILNPNYTTNTLWFDPNPFDSVASIPTNRVDGYSVLLHELGHALAFNGWRNILTGAIGSYASTFDELTVVDHDGFMYFIGEMATSIYGDRVPLTRNNIFHVANNLGFPGDDLITDLMNGVILHRGRRYDISLLDLAIAYDSGVDVNPAAFIIPTPGSGLLLVGAFAIITRRARTL